MRKLFRHSQKKAQHLVEFLLAVPILVIFLVFLTEFAYALNANLALHSALKGAVSFLGENVVPDRDTKKTESIIKGYLVTSLEDSKLPYTDSLKVYLVKIDDYNSAIFAGYTYKPVFTMPNFFVNFMPKTMNFTAFQLIATPIARENRFQDSLSVDDLDKFWHNESAIKGRKGVMKNTLYRDKVAFLLECKAPIGEGDMFKMINFSGEDFESGKIANISNNQVYQCGDSSCSSQGKNYLDFLYDKGVLSVYFVKNDSFDVPFFNQKPLFWLYPEGAEDVSNIAVSGVLKKTLSFMTDSGVTVRGVGENIDVTAYNPAVLPQNEFSVASSGDMVIYAPVGYNASFSGFSSRQGSVVLGDEVHLLK